MFQLKPMTIRGKIISAFTFFLICVCALALFDWWSIVTIQQKLTVSEYVEDMFNNILEARWYEKNFLFYHDRKSLDENIVHVNNTLPIFIRKSQDIQPFGNGGPISVSPFFDNNKLI